MAFKEAKDIFKEKEREEVDKLRRAIIGAYPLGPLHQKRLIDAIIEEIDAARKKREENRRMEIFGKIVAFVFGIAVLLGCIWLIKIFIKGIF